MNTASIYATSAGRSRATVAIDDEMLAANGMLEQQHNEWLKHPETIDLIVFLSSRLAELQNNAMNSANAGQEEKMFKHCLLKAKAIEEVKKYVERKSRPNNA